MSTLFFSSGNAPDAKVILNRNTEFEYEITSDVIDIGCNNDINGIFGNFTVVIDNTNDKHVDRYGNIDIEVMSSIEIFVKSAIAHQNEIPVGINNGTVLTQENQSISSIIDNTYGITAIPYNNGNIAQQQKTSYLKQFASLNQGRVIGFVGKPSMTIQTGVNVNAFADFTLQPGQSFQMPPQIVQYKRIFLGVVENVQQSFSAGTAMTITIMGESLGYWLKSSMINIAPSQTDVGVGTSTSTQTSIFSNKYDDTTALDIFKDLISFSTNDTLAVSDFNLNTNQNSYENLNAQDYLQQNMYDEMNESYVDASSGNSLTLQQAFSNANANPPITVDNTSASVLNGLDQLQTSVQGGTLLDGTKISNLPNNVSDDTTNSNIVDAQNTSAAYNAAVTNYNNVSQTCNANITQQNTNIQNLQSNSSLSNAQRTAQINQAYAQIDLDNQKIANAQQQVTVAQGNATNSPIIQSQINAINNVRQKINSSINNSQNAGRKVLDQLGIINHWKQIFSQIILEVVDAAYLQQIYPFKEILQSPSIMDGDYQSKSTIAKQVSDALNFEFYVDTNGHFILKPPFYNIGIPNDDPTYIIKQEDLISWNIIDTVEGIITRIGVTGDWHSPAQMERTLTYNIHTDLNLVNKYGIHATELHNLIFLKDIISCANFGQTYMAQNNQKLKTATITILGRPDIRLGVACYLLPRDTVYYISSISHNFTAGAQYTTTLTLIGARKIVCGYQVDSKIQTLIRSNVNGLIVRSTTDNNSGQITHWILTNSLSPSSIQASQNNPYTQSAQTQKYFIVKNSYIITSHPNIGYIGLIVSQNSAILNDINYNTFRYIYGAVNTVTSNNPNSNYNISNPTSSLAPSVQWIQSQFGNNKAPFQNILNALIDFIENNINVPGMPDNVTDLQNSLSDAANPVGTNATTTTGATQHQQNIALFNSIAQAFNQAQLDNFISSFLNTISSQIQLAKKDSSSESIQTWSATSSYFNQMVSDISVAGSYSPYTDADGREYPVLLDYGRSFVVENGTISSNTNTPSQQATSPQNQTDAQVNAIISAAQQYLAGGTPNTSQASVQQNNISPG